jgi:TetR/AcrR family transcriptional regulator
VSGSADLKPPRRRASGKQPGRSPGRPRAGEAVDEDAFLTAALRAFAVHGYAGVSVRTLSRELGVSHGWVHQRFGSKEALWYAAVDHGFGRQAATLSFDPTVPDPLEQLEEGIRQFLRYSSEHPELAMMMNTEGAQDTPRLDYINEHYIEPTAAPFVRLLAHLIDEGRARDVPWRTVFFLLAHGATAMFGLVPLGRRVQASDPASAGSRDEHIEAVTRIIVDGLRVDR